MLQIDTKRNKTWLYADIQVLLAESESELRTKAQWLNIWNKYKVKIFTTKFKK
jgi:hypothetical protein